MSTKLNSTLKRLVTFLLVVVMIVGMLPLTVSAGNQGGGSQYSGNSTATSSGKGTGGAPIPGAPIYYGRFTRYTLVRFDFTDDSKVSGLKSVSDWSTGKAVGSIDVVTEVNESIPTNTKYLRTPAGIFTNAFNYRLEPDKATIVDGYPALSGSRVFGTSSVSGFETLKGSGDLIGYPTSYHHENKGKLIGGTDPLMDTVGHKYGDVACDLPLYAPNVVF